MKIAVASDGNMVTIVGATGNSKSAAEQYLNGELKSTGSVCHEHQHSGECNH